MFGTAIEQLEESIDRIAEMVRSVEDVDVVREEATAGLLGLERQRERLEAAVGALMSDLEARGAHEHDSAYSMANWLAARTGQRRDAAGSRVFLARKLRSMPATAKALAGGEITASHASVLSRALNPRTAEAFARDEGVLVASAKKLTADQLIKVVEFWLRHADPDGTEPDPEDRDRFWLSQTLDGRLKGNFDLGGDAAVQVKMVLDELCQQLLAQDKKSREVDPTDPRADETASQRRARALEVLCERAAASPKNPARRQPLFNLHTTIDTLAGTGNREDWLLEIEQAWSSVIATHMTDLWTCDCWMAQILVRGEDGQPLDAGREIRTANRAMRRALVARDGACCAVPGCDRHVGWCDAHHIQWWEKLGHTAVDNLVFVCRWHHRWIHAGHLTVTMVDGRPQFTNSDGLVLVEPRTAPNPPDKPRDPPPGDDSGSDPPDLRAA